jgi:hypothetical protein
MKRPNRTLIVLGMVGQVPFAGVAWQALHYLEGFRRLSFDVSYVEDTGAWPFDAAQNTITDDCGYTLRYLARLMGWAGFGDRWAYCDATGREVCGLSPAQLKALFERAEVLVNLTGATVLREEHRRVPVRVYLETDPVLPQIEVAKGRRFTHELLAAHTHHFTYGENLGAPDCGVPVGPFTYRPTRQPVVLDWWQPRAEEWESGRVREWVSRSGAPIPPLSHSSGPSPSQLPPFTTVATWEQTGKDVRWNGETYTWSKHHEFRKFIDLPRQTAQPLELALACGDAGALRSLAEHGWRVRDALALSRDILPYRDYLLSSRGEWTVAKDQNIRLRSGWFSDRSACYLAAGRPVVTQDTAFDRVLPTGEGLFAFRTMEDAAAALEGIAADYERHARAARAIAHDYFRAETVLGRMVQEWGG